MINQETTEHLDRLNSTAMRVVKAVIDIVKETEPTHGMNKITFAAMVAGEASRLLDDLERLQPMPPEPMPSMPPKAAPKRWKNLRGANAPATPGGTPELWPGWAWGLDGKPFKVSPEIPIAQGETT